MASSDGGSRKRVFVYVPFTTEHTGTDDDHANPNYSAQQWAQIRNANPAKARKKEYHYVSGEKAFNQIKFKPDDRIYVHAHGGDWGEIFAKGGRTSGKEVEGVDKHTPQSLWDSLNKNKTFAALGGSAKAPLDLRIAACHSADEKSFNAQLKKLDSMRTHVALKGKEGEFSANTGKMLSTGKGIPSRKGLVRT